VPPDRLTGNEAAVQQETPEVGTETERPQPRQRVIEVETQPQTTPENATTSNSNDEDTLAILPQEPASFWSTIGGCVVVFSGLFFVSVYLIVGPSLVLGQLFHAPGFGPVMSFLAIIIWLGGYRLYLRRVYWPGRGWVPVQPVQLQVVNKQQFVYSQRECELPRIWKKTWVRREAFPTKVKCPRCKGTGRDPDDRRRRCSKCEGAKFVIEEAADDQHNDNTHSANQAT